ncbi:hypothetical protein GAY29_09545 [Azospirillum brasilense]|nr:hypothetical protein [Azospirillum brasilense]
MRQNNPLPSGERVARRAGEGGALLPDDPPRATPSPYPSPQRGEGIWGCPWIEHPSRAPPSFAAHPGGLHHDPPPRRLWHGPCTSRLFIRGGHGSCRRWNHQPDPTRLTRRFRCCACWRWACSM